MGIGYRSTPPRRAYYPSGPIIDKGYTRIASSSKETEVDKPTFPNPDPNNYKIVKAHEYGPYLIVKINYPDCQNYEGNKILVFEKLTLIELVNQKAVDPHFFQDQKKEFTSPIARFVPSDEGWNMALIFVKSMHIGGLN